MGKKISVSKVFNGPQDMSAAQMKAKMEKELIERLVSKGMSREKAELAISSGAVKLDVLKIR